MRNALNYLKETAIALVVLPIIGIMIALSGKNEIDE